MSATGNKARIETGLVCKDNRHQPFFDDSPSTKLSRRQPLDGRTEAPQRQSLDVGYPWDVTMSIERAGPEDIQMDRLTLCDFGGGWMKPEVPDASHL